VATEINACDDVQVIMRVEKGWLKLRGFKEILFVLEGKPYHNDREWKTS
jgi:hypothetical protein